MVTQKMLEAAMVEAVKRGVFPRNAPQDQYITAWEDMRAVLEAAQQSVHPTCPKCGASLSSGTTPKDGKSHCPSCGASG